MLAAEKCQELQRRQTLEPIEPLRQKTAEAKDEVVRVNYVYSVIQHFEACNPFLNQNVGRTERNETAQEAMRSAEVSWKATPEGPPIHFTNHAGDDSYTRIMQFAGNSVGFRSLDLPELYGGN